MMNRNPLRFALVLFGALSIGCTAPTPSPTLLAPTEAQTKLRAFQSRTLELGDRQLAMRGVIGVLQDLGFIIERANDALGLVTAAKFAEPNFTDIVGVTVTVRPQEGQRMLVRVNAIFNNRPIEDPTVYQNFFAALERSLFVTGG
jgi:hypothetical protein